MKFTFTEPDVFLDHLNLVNPQTPTKSQTTLKTTLSQLIASSSDLLKSQITMKPRQKTILKSQKRRAIASPEVKAIFPENHFKSLSNSDKQLQNARILLKQAMQQFSSPSV